MRNYAQGLANWVPGRYHKEDVYRHLGVHIGPTTHRPEEDAEIIARRMQGLCGLAIRRQNREKTMAPSPQPTLEEVI